MTTSEAQQLAGEYFDDLAEGSPAAYRAWAAIASTVGAPCKPYFMLTMWAWFVPTDADPGFAVPYISSQQSSSYMNPTDAFYSDLPAGYTWSISVTIKAASGSYAGVMFSFGKASGGSGNWDGTPYDNGFLYEGDHAASLPPVSATTSIVLIQGAFPLASYVSNFSWHKGPSMMDSKSDRPLFPPGKSGATS
jgi:hypothetical protein